ncbi:MAG: helix-turn-helix domain-containing protein, partial [Chloroflexi bacterium]|nr:helix-turn-helix domain-containing protein [Chloroflexota bacterium]
MDPIRFGRGIRELRQRRGWRQQDLARAAGVSRSVIARVEQGRGVRLPYAPLAAIATALGARVAVRLDWQGEQLDRLIDARHAALIELVVRELTSLGWACATEVTFSIYGERGSIDVLGFHGETGVLIVVEVKSAIPELGNTLIPLDRKVRLAARIAADRGWVPRSVARLLVVGDATTTRRRIEAHRTVFDVEFPVRGWAVRRWLAAPVPATGWSG